MGPVLSSPHSTALLLICSLGSSQDTAKYMDIIIDWKKKTNYLWQSSVPKTHLSFIVNITYFIDHKLELIIPRQWFVLQVVIWNMSRMKGPAQQQSCIVVLYCIGKPHISFLQYLYFWSWGKIFNGLLTWKWVFFEIVVFRKAPHKTCIGFAFIGIKIDSANWKVYDGILITFKLSIWIDLFWTLEINFKTIIYIFASLKNVLGSGGSLLLTNPAYPISSSYGLK